MTHPPKRPPSDTALASNAFGQSNLLRSRPFDFHRFVALQAHSLSSAVQKMGEQEKARTSGEMQPGAAAGPAMAMEMEDRKDDNQTLPTVNPAATKSEPPKPSFHPAFYVM